MLTTQRGMSLAETLVAMGMASLVALGAARFLPALHGGVIESHRQRNFEEELWQLALTIGKHMRRAGYCQGGCNGVGLTLAPGCMIARWDENANGRLDMEGSSAGESTGYRLRAGQIETRRGVTHCQGNGWERVTDPAGLTITRFAIQRLPGRRGPPLVLLELQGQGRGLHQVQVQHNVRGYNL